jgi:transcriptional regulator with XRE-family HTH domain
MSRTAFGALLKRLRVKRAITLREFCKRSGFDPGNYSRLERGLFGPPQDRSKLEQYARALGLSPGEDDWLEFFDTAAASRGEIPQDLLSDEEVVEKLPLLFRTLRAKPVFRTLRAKPVSPEKLDELVEQIRRG